MHLGEGDRWMAKKKKVSYDAFINRELSWLDFNRRVLDEARDGSVPLLERMKFLAITGSNLDEFFMVRVGGLQMMKEEGLLRRGVAGYTPSQQLRLISRATRKMAAEQYQCLAQLETELGAARVRRVSIDRLDTEQLQYAEAFFNDTVYPILTPVAVDPDGPFPVLIALSLYLLVRLAPTPDAKADTPPRLAVVGVPRNLARWVTVPCEDGHEYVPMEELMAAFLNPLFPGEEVVESTVFRITRNADMRVREDESPDLLIGMENVLEERMTSSCVRLEISKGASALIVDTLKKALSVDPTFLFSVPGPLDLAACMGLASMSGFEELKNEPWTPEVMPDLSAPESMFDILTRRDVLLHHPYDSFEPVVRLIEEAANDPGVLAIKQTLYRTSARSPIVAALIRAAQRGKQVTVIVELKARFDEARNMEWARAMERAGVQVIYGIRGLKTHAKVCIIIRAEAAGIRRYLHFGTGNYNETTARLYTDISYMTCDDDLGADATQFFNTITGYGQSVQFRKIEAAPIGLRARLLESIAAETERQVQGQPGHIMARLNSLVDPQLIEALYKASQAGVKIQLNVRGICCLRPGVPGLSENITVLSIVDRFLEHSRILYFRHGGESLYYISSADWMQRNMDKRIELLVPVESAAARERLRIILETCFRDNVKARELNAKGVYTLRTPPSARKAFRSQEVFRREARERRRALKEAQLKIFKPHLPSSPDTVNA